MERTEVGDRRPTTERDDDAAVDALGERVAPRGELALRNLRRRDLRGAARESLSV